MKTVELRRHSLRTPPEEHLSPEGLRLATWVRAGLGRFDATVSSPATRAVETAVGLGHPPDRIDPLWLDLGDSASAELNWPTTFGATRKAVDRPGSASRRKAEELWQALARYLADVPDGGALLVVTHGGFSELVVAGSGLGEGASEEDGPARCLEGVRFEIVDGRASSFRILRLPAGKTRI